MYPFVNSFEKIDSRFTKQRIIKILAEILYTVRYFPVGRNIVPSNQPKIIPILVIYSKRGCCSYCYSKDFPIPLALFVV